MSGGPTRTNPPYWPGGIPSHIRCHAEPIPADAWDDEVKGWLLYVDENIVPRPGNYPANDEFELNQRRRLVSQWASLTQTDRDGYQSRAELRPTWKPPVGTFKANHKYFPDDTCIVDNTINCVVPQPMTPRNRALLAKVRIMLYQLDGGDGPIIEDDPDVTICVPNPAQGPGAAVNPGPDFIMWSEVENANFGSMFMTGTGTVVVHYWYKERILIDQEALDTGRVYFCRFEPNGQVEHGCHIRTQAILCEWWIMVTGLGHRVTDLMGDREVWKFTSKPESPNGPLNMEQPILDILEDCKPYLQGGIDEWMDDIERYAPGYLEMEEAGNGMAPDYDHSRFRNQKQLACVPRQEFDNTRVF